MVENQYFNPKIVHTVSYSPIPITYEVQSGILEDGFLSNAQLLTNYFNERHFDGIVEYKNTLEADSTYLTDSYSMSSGDVISITGSFIPSDQTIEVGVVRTSDQYAEVVSVTRNINYSYTVPTSDSYLVYLHNPGSQPVEALGTIEFVR